MTNFWLIAICSLFVYSIYLIWASTKISVRQDENFYRIEYFEQKLDLRPGKYNCILVGEADTWTKTNYAEIRDKIIESPKFRFNFIVPIHYLGVSFSLKAIEKDKIIYVAMGSDSYNWDSPKARMRRRNHESKEIEDYS